MESANSIVHTLDETGPRKVHNPNQYIFTEDEKAAIQKQNFWRGFFLCCLSFLGMYVALYSAQNISAVLFLKDGYSSLGFYSNAFAYLGEGVGSIICVYIIMKMGSAKSMSRFAIGNLPFILCLLLPAIKSEFMQSTSFFLSDGFVYVIVTIASVVNGFAMGVVQPASGTYIAECATEQNKGFYFAFFWSFYMGSQVFGNLIAAFILGNFSQISYVILMLIICSISVALLFFLREPVSINNKSLMDPIEIDAPPPTVQQGALKLLKLLFNRRFMWILPQTIWTGVSIAYFSGNLVEMLQDSINRDDQYEFKWSMFAMVFFGFGQIFGSFFIGYFIDRKSSRFAALVNVGIIIVLSSVTFAFIVIYEFNILAYIMCFMWGFQDSAVNTHAQEILGFEFDDNYTPFSLYGIIQSLSCFIFQIVVSGVNTKDQFFNYTIFTTILSLICVGATYFFPFTVKNHKSDDYYANMRFLSEPKLYLLSFLTKCTYLITVIMDLLSWKREKTQARNQARAKSTEETNAFQNGKLIALSQSCKFFNTMQIYQNIVEINELLCTFKSLFCNIKYNLCTQILLCLEFN